MHDMQQTASHGGKRAYLRLLAMALLSFVAMYALMFAMVNTVEDVKHNLNQVYMAALMAGPMVLIELALMRSMYPHPPLTAAAAGISLVVAVASFVGIRQQAVVGDEQFLRSMIPHHSGAILMCQQAAIEDPQISELCERIVESQRAEIDEMRVILDRLE